MGSLENLDMLLPGGCKSAPFIYFGADWLKGGDGDPKSPPLPVEEAYVDHGRTHCYHEEHFRVSVRKLTTYYCIHFSLPMLMSTYNCVMVKLVKLPKHSNC